MSRAAKLTPARPGPAATSRLLVWIAAIDLGLTPIALFFWLVVIEVVDPRVMLPAVALRLIVTGLLFVHMLRPIRAALTRDERADDDLLLRADRAVQDLDTRMTLVYGGGWLLTAGTSLLLAVLGVPVEIPLGGLELATAITMTVSLAAVSLPIRALVRSLIFAPHRRIAELIMQRRLALNRSPRSVGNIMRAVMIGIILSTVPAMMMAGAHLHVAGVRTNATTEVLRKAERAALELERPGPRTLEPEFEPEFEPEIQVVTSDELPPPLRPSSSRFESLRGYDRGDRVALAAVPLDDGRWLLARAEVDEQLGVALALVFTVTAFALGCSVLVSNALWHAQSRLLDELDEATRRSVEVGDIGALARLVPMNDDELGRLAHNFNRMLDTLDELTQAATAVAEGKLDVELEHPGELHDAFRGMLAQLSRVVPRIRATAVELAGAATQIQAAMRAQDRSGRQQSLDMVNLREAVRALSSAAAEIADETAAVRVDAEQASAATLASSEEIASLRDHASGISDLLESIREIADRSDLLALNGSLEATRAGDAGRGFALVAAEMRRLAERVTALVQDVRGRLADIERAGQSSVSVTERSRELARSTAGAARRIAGLIEGQQRATAELESTVEGVAEAVGDVTRTSVQTHAAAAGLAEHASRLEQLTRRFDEDR